MSGIVGRCRSKGNVPYNGYSKFKLDVNYGEIDGESFIGGASGLIKESVFANIYNTGDISCVDTCAAAIGKVVDATLNSLYYLEDSYKVGIFANNGRGSATKSTKDEMQSKDFLENLSDKFVYKEDDFPLFEE